MKSGSADEGCASASASASKSKKPHGEAGASKAAQDTFGEAARPEQACRMEGGAVGKESPGAQGRGAEGGGGKCASSHFDELGLSEVRESERTSELAKGERGREGVCVCVCVCKRERARARERERERERE